MSDHAHHGGAARTNSTATSAVALVGRPNSGKSSVFNALTGGGARVGNFPGVTVDVLEGETTLPSGAKTRIVDLPGLYSIEATVDTGTDEGVARAYLEKKRDAHDFVVAQVLDPTRLALGLRLTRELVRAKLPVVLVLTHKDILADEGRAVDVEALAQQLDVPVVLVDAREEGAKRAVLAAVEDRLRAEVEKPLPAADFDPARIAGSVVRDVGSEREKARRRLTERLDAVLLHPVVGPLVFLGLMTLVFAAVFLVADPTADLMDRFVGYARGAIAGVFGKGLVTSFLADGVLGGAGTVAAFMPQIVILTIALELLDASGYLARGAFLVDRVLRLMGLSGRSFLPLLMGHACAVPAIAATRIVRDPRERLTTILVLPFMTCAARLPTYGLVIATFFAARSAFFQSLLFVSLYFAGIVAALVASLVIRRTVAKGKGLPLVLEMPAYRVPLPRVIARKASQSAVRFLRDVGTTILVASAALWLLSTIPAKNGDPSTPAIERSVAAVVGHAIEPVTRPAGFDWRIDIGLIASFGQRELMVGTMGVIFGVEKAEDDPAPLTEHLRGAFPTRTGLALLAFFVLACQCMSTVAAIRRETGGLKWPAFVVAYTYSLAYAAAVLVYQVGGLLGIK